MSFAFKSQLRFVIPMKKNVCLKRTLDSSVSEGNLIDTIRFWFPVMDKIILNARQGRLRAYNKLPEHFLLFYEKMIIDNGRQKWEKIYKIKVFRDLTMQIYDYRNQEVRIVS